MRFKLTQAAHRRTERAIPGFVGTCPSRITDAGVFSGFDLAETIGKAGICCPAAMAHWGIGVAWRIIVRVYLAIGHIAGAGSNSDARVECDKNSHKRRLGEHVG